MLSKKKRYSALFDRIDSVIRILKAVESKFKEMWILQYTVFSAMHRPIVDGILRLPGINVDFLRLNVLNDVRQMTN